MSNHREQTVIQSLARASTFIEGMLAPRVILISQALAPEWGTGSVQRETDSQSQSVFIQSGFVFVYGRGSAFTFFLFGH